MDLGVLEKVPPHSIEAEQSVLGSLILDRDLLPDITAVLKSEDFYLEQHKEIFEAILDLYEQNKPVDLITVSEQLTKGERLTGLGITNIFLIWRQQFPLPLMRCIMPK